MKNKKCPVFHICLFNERYDFCDFDIGCSNVSTNSVIDRARLHWSIKRKPKIHVLILGGASCNFQSCVRGGSIICVPKGGGGPCVFYQPHFQMLRPTPLYTFWPVPKSPNFEWSCTYTRGEKKGQFSRSQERKYTYISQHQNMILSSILTYLRII